ncbi:DUF1206 domain-containing protein [Leifsonia sp. fls2-241-R2A-40a]|uniref:DUF1206 domain-containing protein n=1 Tax=Leifsonia sp. fls2-241-R2A-40a TaxID=3040290 RepID=UPI00254A7C0F|nr:DUF1206 domain-containing protein [Leifsonia sp. fls2-241-R2A-40a]
MSPSAKQAARTAKNSRVVRGLARAGFVASGLLHILIGLIAIALATGTSGGKEADQSGAFAELAAAPGGQFLLWAAALCFTALGLWLLLSAFLDRSWEGARSRAAHIVENIVKAIVYLVLAYTAYVFAIGGAASSAQSTSQFGAKLLSTPGGVFLVVAIGLVLLGVGGFMVFKGITRRFERDIRVPSGVRGTAVRVLGVVGYVARGVALGAVGVLFVVGASTNDPGKTTGLDGALKAFLSVPFGVFVLIAIGIGWIAYGIYAFFRARLAQL